MTQEQIGNVRVWHANYVADYGFIADRYTVTGADGCYRPKRDIENIFTSGEVFQRYLRMLPPKQVIHATMMNS